VNCYRHSEAAFNFRARLDDLLEVERSRSGQNLEKTDASMKWPHASKLMNSAILVMKILGWSWRWAELWVDYDSPWEPLIEPEQREEDMTKEELKIVDSTRESRCRDARHCRLAAFGAALRNRSYDLEVDFDRESFDKALRAVLRTKSLSGPLEDIEIEFLTYWLTLAYWSKSRLLGFAEDKIVLNTTSELCRHTKDGSSKFELGSRPLPGKKEIYDASEFNEVDEFMMYQLVELEQVPSKSPQKAAPHKRKVKSTPLTGSPNKLVTMTASPLNGSRSKRKPSLYDKAPMGDDGVERERKPGRPKGSSPKTGRKRKRLAGSPATYLVSNLKASIEESVKIQSRGSESVDNAPLSKEKPCSITSTG
jgi:hypothetical protein